MKRLLFVLIALSGLCFAQAPPEETPMRNLMRTKGDMITHNGVGPVRLAACPDGQVHVADSTQAVGYSCLPNGQAAGAVTSVFGRNGAVVALAADYGTFYAPITHTHIISDVTGLQAALDAKQNALGYTAENTANKGASNGYAPLDAGSKIPVTYIPALNYQAPLGFTPENSSNKGAASGYAPLDATSKVPAANLPTVQSLLGFTPENVANKTVDTTFGGASPSNTLYPSQAAVKTYADSHLQGRAVSATAPADLQVLQWSATNSQWQPATVSGGGGGGITSLNGLTALSQTFANSNDTNVTLSIGSVTSTHTFTLGWTGTLAKARQHVATVYNDQANTFGAFLQDFSGSTWKVPSAVGFTPSGSSTFGFDLTSSTFKGWNGTLAKTFAFTDSNITGNAATATALAATPSQCGANQFSTGVAASGNANCAQPAFSNLSGSVAAAQLPAPTATTLGGVESKDCTAGGQFIQKINIDGTETCGTPASGGNVSASGMTAGSIPIATSTTAIGNSHLSEDANGRLIGTRGIAPALVTVTFSATPAFDLSQGDTFVITLTGNVTSSTLSNLTAGQKVVFIICQDATGSRTFVWPTNVLGASTIGSNPSKCNVQPFVAYNSNLYAVSTGVLNQ